MKLQALPKQEVHRTGIDKGARKRFSVSTSAKTFKILSSTIYKHKIRAIIREISCNAIDGHIAGGFVGNFDVQMPTVLDPRFVVRDYGIGLDGDQIQDMYTTYFESTKTESNDFIGALGLGSKSPFCYADTFTVESVKDGIKRGFVAYMENGEPFVDPIYEIESDEHSGVTVIVPVKVEDIKEWETEACRVYSVFGDTRPNFIGVDPGVVYLPGIPDENESPLIKVDSDYWKGLFARMGNILYPIDQEMYRGTLLAIYTDQSKCNILDFPLGSLDFMPSREELSLDKITRKTILDKAGTLNRKYHKMLLEDFNKNKTVREKMKFYHGISYALRAYADKYPEFHVDGKTVTSLLTQIDLDKTYEDMSLRGYWANSKNDASSCEYMLIGRGRKHKSETMKRRRLSTIFEPWQQMKLYVIEMDIKKHRGVLVGHSLKTNRLVYGSTHYVSYSPHNPASLERIQKVIETGYFDPSEVVYLKASEMHEELALYEKEYPRSLRDKKGPSEEPRPKTPTAIRMFMDDSGLCTGEEELFLTRKEFRALPASVGVRVFGTDDVSSLNGKEKETFSLFQLPYNDQLLGVMKALELKEVYFVRNRLWDAIPDSNMVDLDDLMEEHLLKTLKELKPNNHRPVISSSSNEEKSGAIHSAHYKFNIPLNRLVKANPKEKACDDADTLVKLLRTNTTNENGTLPNNPKFQKLYVKFKTDKAAMQKRVVAAYTKFKELNPFVATVIESTHEIGRRWSGQVMNDCTKHQDNLMKIIRWK